MRAVSQFAGNGVLRAGSNLFHGLLTVVVWLVFASHVHAQATEAGWQFEVTPYLFASSMKGDTKAGALPTTHVDLSFSDIVQNLDFGYMGILEARKNRWIIFTDLMYMRVSGDASVTGPRPTGPAVTVGADATVKQTMFSAALGYRVLEGATSLDLFGGARYNKIDVDADISGSLFGLSARVNRSGDKSWWDPYAAFRLIHRLDDKWSLVAYADAGGFGVGSDLTWQALFGANYAFSKTVTGKLGFRILKVDYDNGGFLYDMKNQGLVVGVGMKF